MFHHVFGPQMVLGPKMDPYKVLGQVCPKRIPGFKKRAKVGSLDPFKTVVLLTYTLPKNDFWPTLNPIVFFIACSSVSLKPFSKKIIQKGTYKPEGHEAPTSMIPP